MPTITVLEADGVTETDIEVLGLGRAAAAASKSLALSTEDKAVLDAIAASVAGATPAGTNAIGKLSANSGVDIGDVDVTSIVPGTGATSLGKAVDNAVGATDTGVAVLAARLDTLATLTPASGDYAVPRMNARGALWVALDSTAAQTVTLAAGTATNEVVGDAAHDAAAAGNPVLMGGYASAAAPTNVSADADVVRAWYLRNGAAVSTLISTAGSNGQTSTRVVSAATTNATSVKASAGRIGRIDLFNTSASLRYFKLYNKASAPTVGTDTPVWTIPLPAGTGFSSDFMFGKYFATGIAYAITGALADADTTAIGSGDIHGSIDWI